MSAASVRITRHESGRGAWEVVSRDPDRRLREHVARFCGYREQLDRPLRRRELPSTDVVVVLSFGPSIDVSDPAAGAALVRRTSFVAGLDPRPSTTRHDGRQLGLQLDLTPLGAFAFLGVPPGELAGTVLDLEDVLGRSGTLLVERLHEAPGWEARFELLERTILERAEACRPATPDVAWAWRRLRETDGRLPIGELARELRCSRRHLSGRFREQVGLPPKTFARLLRFDRAARRLREDGAPRLAEIAFECGYSDQAHFNRDFREFAGWTPTELRGRVLPGGAGLAGA
jgi:AraC-like DNA-binding protein